MMFVLGIGSAVGMSTGIITVINEQFPRLKTWYIVVPVCLSGFLIGTVYVTPVSIKANRNTRKETFVIYDGKIMKFAGRSVYPDSSGLLRHLIRRVYLGVVRNDRGDMGLR